MPIFLKKALRYLTASLDRIQEAYAAMDERRAIKTLLTVSEIAQLPKG
jgi:hypothetical protein